jgi:hypothetical protein
MAALAVLSDSCVSVRYSYDKVAATVALYATVSDRASAIEP